MTLTTFVKNRTKIGQVYLLCAMITTNPWVVHKTAFPNKSEPWIEPLVARSSSL